MQYYKQNAAAISSRMVKTIEKEEAEKALQKQNKGNTTTTSSRTVKPVAEHQEEADKSSQKQNKSDMKIMIIIIYTRSRR